MLRTCQRRLESRACRAEGEMRKIQATDQVANVKKETVKMATVSNRGRPLQRAVHEDSGDRQRAAKRKREMSVPERKKIQINDTNIARNNEGESTATAAVTHTQFVEDNQIIDMSVTADEDGEFPGDEMAESEVSDTPEECLNSQRSSQDSQNATETKDGQNRTNERSRSQTRSRSGSSDQEDFTNEQIKRIDQEMSAKLLELHQLMSAKDMGESVDMINKCTEILKAKQKQGKNVNSNARVQMNKTNDFVNSVNREKDNGNIVNSRSVETIYESAIPKRNSSSS